ncbi:MULTISPECIES: DUF2188 domain-containing protein [Rhizobium/Agrobacterium group]|uniref:DUF2188 domain-containing protein n=2 Tax=Rhizobium/Agrobacterium group TaxID=227290 RepID=A0AA92C4E9_RHIRH|nr:MULTISPECIES: DUF2188 domain-containing protein [Rhizobium/Agrobacterium group]KQR30275.1 hypothetical protein ASF91_15830 [Rhizobium sp. Leaf155]MDP9571813.1 hypothetical protein [Agrobacterium larrymoorei]MQB19379.1 DUF2188 domain-containing protein [Agrobacterium tumefaciens]PVE75847.1 DUF2188 domain-containing protein [Sphingomonas sp. TPD3009]MDD1497731.1 DUF2188 domain-containing protein [Agrobacterium sp. CNPSo 3708]
MAVVYHVDQHDGGFAYRVDDVWSETFPDHDTALEAARDAARRQQIGGDEVEISYQLADGHWQSQHVKGGDRPETDVVDDTADR